MSMQYGMYPPNAMPPHMGSGHPYPVHTPSPPPPPPPGSGSRAATGGDYNAAFPPLG